MIDTGKAKEIDNRSVALLDELEGLLTNPRAKEIVANDWLHDGSLSVPSLDLILYLGIRMLTGDRFMIEISQMDRYSLIKNLLTQLRIETLEERRLSIPRVLRRLDCYRFLHTGKHTDPHIHEWLPIVWNFLYPDAKDDDAEANAIIAGKRAVSRGLIETMTLRAIFTLDHDRLKSLAEALKTIRHNKVLEPTVENRVIGEILRCLPYLNEELGKLPSRAELEYFIRELAAWSGEKEFPKRANPWSDAFHWLGYEADPRQCRIDKPVITKLARKVSEFTV